MVAFREACRARGARAVFLVLAAALLTAGQVRAAGAGTDSALLMQDSVHSIVFVLADEKLPSKSAKRFGIVEIACQASVKLSLPLTAGFSAAVDSVRPVTGVVGTCFGALDGYDSYLTVYLKGAKEVGVHFVCTDYHTGIVRKDASAVYYVHFANAFADSLSALAGQVRESMCPCRSVRKK